MRDDDAGLDPAASLRLIHEQQEHARRATEPDGRILYGTWGTAWLVGYLCLYGSATAGGAVARPAPWAFAVFGTLILAAVAVTVVHSVVRRSGTRGVSARTGRLYGWAWFLGFLSYALVLGGLARAGASDTVMGLASNAFACLVVGLLYLAGGLVFGETRLYVLGVWMLLVAGVATALGMPWTYLALAVAGGGGFLLLAVLEEVLRRRSRHAVVGPAAGDTPTGTAAAGGGRA